MPSASLTPRGKALRHLTEHRGITEFPAGSNSDNRPHANDKRWGIRKAQTLCAGGGSWLHGTPWCGTWCFWALRAAKVEGLSSRLASVALIEDDARTHRAPFFDWKTPSQWHDVNRGDLVVMFGRGVHVEVVRSFDTRHGSVVVITEGGNTSSGSGGSQSNGGGAFRRERNLRDVHGFARVNYPGGRKRLERVAAAVTDTTTRATHLPAPIGDLDEPATDTRLLGRLDGTEHVEAQALHAAVRDAHNPATPPAKAPKGKKP
jgi:hypothetical protein